MPRTLLNLENQLDAALSEEWGSDAKAIVIEPEVDIWMWGAETHIREVVDWHSQAGIRGRLAHDSDFYFSAHGKPERPKEALEAVFRHAQLPRSSAHYEALARRLSLARCQTQLSFDFAERWLRGFNHNLTD